MNAFEVKDMTCGHCVGTITKAVEALDPVAKVRIDLATHRFEIESSGTPAAQWIDVIETAGYTPVTIQDGVRSATTGVAPVRSGCCCG